jgi:hypothetical protein
MGWKINKIRLKWKNYLRFIKQKIWRYSKMDWSKIWVKIETIRIDTGPDDEETIKKLLLSKKKKGIINFTKYKEFE